jgi:ADP-ribosyl-[dinitrogen reductase] hydrolase
MSSSLKNKFYGTLIGGAVGDALGTTAEFVPSHVLEREPVTDLIGQGKFKLEPGMFTDDTSMMLCLCESLLLCNGRFDGLDQQQKYYAWYMDGHMSSNGVCFDIGKTTRKHLIDNIELNRAFDPNVNDLASGNGSLMRLAPVPLFYLSVPHLAIEYSGQSTMTTHPSEIARDCCRYYAALIIGAILGSTKEELLSPLYVPPGLDSDYWTKNPLRQEVLDVVQNCSYKTKNPPEIRNNAYVVPTMEAALWAFYHTDNYKDGALKCVNLGDDADTTGCIYGQLAGAYYGSDGIPKEWIDRIVLSQLFTLFNDELYSIYEQNVHVEHKDTEDPTIKFQLSNKFSTIHELFMALENKYHDIRRRVDPCPKMYKSTDELDKDIKQFESDFLQLLEQHADESIKQPAIHLLQDFQKRLKLDQTTVQKRSNVTQTRGNLLSALRKPN